jgi:DNA mismatch repair protein MutS2
VPEIDRFLDACAREGRDEVRVVHGHGTGRLRIGVRAHLKGHPLVASFRPGGAGEGGDGATVVTLR